MTNALLLLLLRQDMDAGGLARIVNNSYAEDEFSFKAPRILVAKARGVQCFDTDHYRAANPDVATLSTTAAAWTHFTFYGQFERRPHRYGTTVRCTHRMI